MWHPPHYIGGLGYKSPTPILLVSYPQYNTSPIVTQLVQIIFDTYATISIIVVRIEFLYSFLLVLLMQITAPTVLVAKYFLSLSKRALLIRSNFIEKHIRSFPVLFGFSYFASCILFASVPVPREVCLFKYGCF